MPRGINDYDTAELQGRNVANSNSVNIVSPGLITDGLVLHLDAGNYVSYPAAGTTWFDLSNTQNNGTLTNSPVFSTADGGAIAFNGSNQRVPCGNSYQLKRPFSLNSWFRFSALEGWQTITCQDSSLPALASFYWSKTIHTGTPSPRINNSFGLSLVNSSGVEVFTFDGTAVSTNIWYNYSVSVFSNSILLYRNGALVTTTSNSDTMTAATGTLAVAYGFYGRSVVDYLNGSLAFTSVYDRALTPEEVSQNFNATRARFGV